MKSRKKDGDEAIAISIVPITISMVPLLKMIGKKAIAVSTVDPITISSIVPVLIMIGNESMVSIVYISQCDPQGNDEEEY